MEDKHDAFHILLVETLASKQLYFGEPFLCPFPSNFGGPNSLVMFGAANTRVMFYHPHWPADSFLKYR